MGHKQLKYANFDNFLLNIISWVYVYYKPPSGPYSPGAKMGTWKCLRVQGFMIDPESIGVLKEIKLGCHDGNLGELFLFA